MVSLSVPIFALVLTDRAASGWSANRKLSETGSWSLIVDYPHNHSQDRPPLWYIAPVLLANEVFSVSLRGNIVGDRKSNRWTDG